MRELRQTLKFLLMGLLLGALINLVAPPVQATPLLVTSCGSYSGSPFTCGSSGGNQQNVAMFNDVTGAYLGVFADGQFGNPVGIALGPDGNIYVSGNNANGIAKVNLNGTTGASLGIFANLPLGAQAEGIAFGPDGNLYVSSPNTHQIMRYDGTTGADLGSFASLPNNGTPYGLAFGMDGNLYVSDYTGGEIIKFNNSGQLSGAFASSGFIVNPTGLAFGPDGNLYVSSEANDDVVRIIGPLDNSAGVTVGIFGGGGGLSGPHGLTFGPDGNLYVVSRNTNTVMYFDHITGQNLGVFASGGLQNPQYLLFQGGGIPVGIPEPGTMALFGLGLVGLTVLRRRWKSRVR